MIDESAGETTPPGERARVLRVVDAAANRAREGLRVVEDFVRFVLDDSHLTDRLKRVRHDLHAALATVPAEGRLESRETQADVGTQLSLASELHRGDTAAVAAASFARLQEALRVLEEFGKLLDPDLSATMKQLRYGVYTLERAVLITHRSVERLANARLYVLIDGNTSQEGFSRLAESLVEAQVDVIQLRDKQLDDRELLERARLLRKITAEGETLFVMNDRPDLALLCRADGVHVGQEELTVKDVRTVFGPGVLVGVSTHTIEQARQAVLDGADYLGVGPTFASSTKQFDQLAGLPLLRAVSGEISLPAFAVGGIGLTNIRGVLEAGFCRIAVGGAVVQSSDPAAALRELLSRLEEA